MGDGSTLVEVLAARSSETPDRVAYRYVDGETLTYGGLYDRAAGIAGRVAATGTRGDRVLVPSVFGPAFVAAFFGCLLAGRVPVPVAHPRGTRGNADLVALAADCEATAVLAPSAVPGLPWLSSDAPGVPIDEPVMPAGEDIALLQYTSGSTRSPRGVVVSHANLTHNLDAITRAFGTEPDHRGVFWLPPHHDMGLVGGLLAAVHTGCPVTLMSPTAFLRDPLCWLRAIADNGRTVSGGPNFCYDHAVRKVSAADAAGLDLSRWDVAFVGAEPVNPAVLARFAEHFAPAGFRPESFLPCYGLAESTLLVTAARKGSGVRTADGVVGCGAVTGNLAIVGADGRRVAPGETGEIWVSGRSVARGYWRAADEPVFGATLTGEPGTYLRTGDLGFERDGELFVTGRAKELVVIRGRNIVPQDVEWSVEASHPELHAGSCAAVGITENGEERLAVLVELDARKAAPELETSIRHVVSRDHGTTVHRVVFLRPGQLPRTTSGKVQRRKAAVFASGDLSGPPVSGLTSTDIPARGTSPGISARRREDTGNRPANAERSEAMSLSGPPVSGLSEHEGLARNEPGAFARREGRHRVQAREDRAERGNPALPGQMVRWLAERVGVPAEKLDAGQPLTALGVDSVRAAELTTYVERTFGHTISAQRLFDGLTIAELAADLGARPQTVERAPGVAVQLSLFCFARDTDSVGKNGLFLECARFADRHDFHAIWVPERNFPRYGGPFPNPAVLGAALATATTRVRIRAGSVVQDAVGTAQEWSVVDNLAQGRVDLAFAADDHDTSLAAAGQVRKLWRGEPWVLCRGDADRFARAGAAGANIVTALLLQDVDTLRTKIDAYRQARAAHGHDAGHVTLLVQLRTDNPLRMTTQAQRLAAAGVDELACLVDLGLSREEVLTELRRLTRLRPVEVPVRPGVFGKAEDFDLAAQLTEAGLMPFYPDLSDSDGATVAHAGRRLIMLGANNYLGLTADKRVREASAAAALAEGPSVSGSRLLNGSTQAQRDLEHALARFVGRPDALVFATGYQANIGLLSAFMGEGTVLVVDEECHASSYDGVAVGGGRFVRFRHNDVADLDRKLTVDVGAAPAMVMVDGVYSMSGDLAPLREIRAVCDRHGVPLAVDDAHGLGMAGISGRGTEEELDVPGCADVLTGTFSKSLASVGGWLAGPAKLMDWVRFHGRSMVFSAAIPPPAVAAAARALEILSSEPNRVAKVRELATYWREGLAALGFETGTSRTAIVPVNVGDEFTCLRFARALLDGGVYANCVLAPAVPVGGALIRTTVTAAHEPHHLDDALAVFASAGREVGLIPG